MATSELECGKQINGNKRTLNLYFVSTPLYTLFADTFSSAIVVTLVDLILK